MWTSACRRCSTLSFKQFPGTRSADLCRIKPFLWRDKNIDKSLLVLRDEQKSRPTLATWEIIESPIFEWRNLRRSDVIINICSIQCPFCAYDRNRAKGNALNLSAIALSILMYDQIKKKKKNKLRYFEKCDVTEEIFYFVYLREFL